ncbi:MAG: hypothetical protein IJX94_04735 [Clostridia bacterium]|nr:hypothetical protein [Clostridia bacterium]
MKESRTYESPKAKWIYLTSEEILSISDGLVETEQLTPEVSGGGDDWDW